MTTDAAPQRIFEHFTDERLRQMADVLRIGDGRLPWATSELQLIRDELAARGLTLEVPA